jgi:hypothetical protein
MKRSSALSARRACCSAWLLSHDICAEYNRSDSNGSDRRFIP